MIVSGFIPMLGPVELGLILVLVLMLFGLGRIPNVMRQLGRSVAALKNAATLSDEDG